MSGPPTSADGRATPVRATPQQNPRSGLPAGPAAGTVLRGRFRLTGTLAIGCAAATYQAEDIETGRPVTVRILHEIGRNDRDRIQAFHRRSSSRGPRPELSESFVPVPVCDLTDEGQLFLVADAVQGRSLAEILRQPAALAPARALELATRIGEAVDAALNLGILNLPLSPQDIVIDDADRVRLLRSDMLVLRQLGLAEQVAAAEASELDPRFQSPEERAGLPPTELSVIYRFGAILHQLLGAEAPAEGARPAGASDGTASRRYRDRRLKLPSSLKRLMAGMVALDPAARPTDPTTILNELWNAACQVRSAASTEGAASPRARRLLLLAGLSIVVVGGAFLAGRHLGIVPTAPAPAPVPGPEQPTVVTSPPSRPAAPIEPLVVPQPTRSQTPVEAPSTTPVAKDSVSAPTRGSTGAATPSETPGSQGTAANQDPRLTPTPPAQSDPVVTGPPARPTPPASENPRAADPGAIIDWLVREPPRLGN